MFVERLLRNHLSLYGIQVERPVLAATTFDPQGQRGGFVHWEAIKFDLRQSFADDPDPRLRFTTFLDVYAMPAELLSLSGFAQAISLPNEIETVQATMERELQEPRFKAYLQRHEMEALLLAVPDSLERVFHRHLAQIQQLRAEIAGFAHAEEIDHGPDTHPSARLVRAIPRYRDLKASNAYFVLADAGLDAVRKGCPRFHDWLAYWEQWGMS